MYDFLHSLHSSQASRTPSFLSCTSNAFLFSHFCFLRQVKPLFLPPASSYRSREKLSIESPTFSVRRHLYQDIESQYGFFRSQKFSRSLPEAFSCKPYGRFLIYSWYHNILTRVNLSWFPYHSLHTQIIQGSPNFDIILGPDNGLFDDIL